MNSNNKIHQTISLKQSEGDLYYVGSEIHLGQIIEYLFLEKAFPVLPSLREKISENADLTNKSPDEKTNLLIQLYSESINEDLPLLVIKKKSMSVYAEVEIEKGVYNIISADIYEGNSLDYVLGTIRVINNDWNKLLSEIYKNIYFGQPNIQFH